MFDTASFSAVEKLAVSKEKKKEKDTADKKLEPS